MIKLHGSSLAGSNTYNSQQPGQDFIGQGHHGKVKLRSHHDIAHLQPTANVPTKYQLPTRYGLQENFIGQAHYGKVKVQLRSHHDAAHLRPLTNVPTKYQLPIYYVFRDIAR